MRFDETYFSNPTYIVDIITRRTTDTSDKTKHI